jgi:hypothetical protein
MPFVQRPARSLDRVSRRALRPGSDHRDGTAGAEALEGLAHLNVGIRGCAHDCEVVTAAADLLASWPLEEPDDSLPEDEALASLLVDEELEERCDSLAGDVLLALDALVTVEAGRRLVADNAGSCPEASWA